MMTEDNSDRRDRFLIEMYKECSGHLNRHILISWQSVGVLAGALAVFVIGDKLDAKTDARIDYVIAIVVLLCGWLYAHLHDANNWFNRNMHLITNIERQFLRPTDVSEIHFYFKFHRPPKLIMHFRIQWSMAVALWLLVLMHHFHQRIYPGFQLSWAHFEWWRSIPYVMTLLCLMYCAHVARNRKLDYEELVAKSPGKAVE
jgi:hypothetical protein